MIKRPFQNEHAEGSAGFFRGSSIGEYSLGLLIFKWTEQDKSAPNYLASTNKSIWAMYTFIYIYICI